MIRRGRSAALLCGVGAALLPGPLPAADPLHAPPASLPPPDYRHFHDYIHTLQSSPLSRAKAILQQIAAGPASLARERTAARREGIPLEMKDLDRPLPPAQQNAGPLYAQLEQPGYRNRVDLPYYAYALTTRYSYTPDQLQKVQAAIDSRPEYMTLVRRATDRPYCNIRAKIPRDPMEMVTSILPSYALWRQLARLLKTESYLLARQGHYSEAIKEQARGFRVATHAGSDILGSTSYLVGEVCDRLSLDGMKDILYIAGPNREVDLQVEETIAKNRPRLSLRDSLLKDVPSEISYLQDARKSGPGGLIRVSESSSDIDRNPIPEQHLSPSDERIFHNLLDAQEADYLHRMRGLIRAAEKPEPLRHPVFAQFAKIERDNPVEWLSAETSSKNVMDTIDTRMHTDEVITMVAAAALAVRGETGKFPLQLPGRFIDPFTGKALKYHREGSDGFVVYSAGPGGASPTITPDAARQDHRLFFRYPPPPPVPVPPFHENPGYPSAPPSK